jgi:hypothetical protein
MEGEHRIDSQPRAESREHGFDLASVPYCPAVQQARPANAMSADEMYRMLNYKREPTFEGVATTGVGVFDTFKAVAKQILIELRKR